METTVIWMCLLIVYTAVFTLMLLVTIKHHHQIKKLKHKVNQNGKLMVMRNRRK